MTEERRKTGGQGGQVTTRLQDNFNQASFYARTSNTIICREIRDAIAVSNVTSGPITKEDYKAVEWVNSYGETVVKESGASVQTIALPTTVNKNQAATIERQLGGASESRRAYLSVQERAARSIDVDPGAREWSGTAVWRNSDVSEFIQNTAINLGSDDAVEDGSRLMTAQDMFADYGLNQGVVYWKDIWVHNDAISDNIIEYLESQEYYTPSVEVHELFDPRQLADGIANLSSLGIVAQELEEGGIGPWLTNQGIYKLAGTVPFCITDFTSQDEEGYDQLGLEQTQEPVIRPQLDLHTPIGEATISDIATNIHQLWVDSSDEITIHDWYNAVVELVLVTGDEEEREAKLTKIASAEPTSGMVRFIEKTVEQATVASFIITNLTMRLSTWLRYLPAKGSGYGDDDLSIMFAAESEKDFHMVTSVLGVYMHYSFLIADQATDVKRAGQHGRITECQILGMFLYRDYLISALHQAKATINVMLSGDSTVKCSLNAAMNSIAYPDFVALASTLTWSYRDSGSESTLMPRQQMITLAKRENVNRTIMKLGAQGAKMPSFLYNLPTDKIEGSLALSKFDDEVENRQVLGKSYIAFEEMDLDGNVSAAVEMKYTNFSINNVTHFMSRVISRGMYLPVVNMLQMMWCCDQKDGRYTDYPNAQLKETVEHSEAIESRGALPSYFNLVSSADCTRGLKSTAKVITRDILYNESSISGGSLGSSAINGIHGLSGPVTLDAIAQESGTMAEAVATQPLQIVLAQDEFKVDMNESDNGSQVSLILGYPLAALSIKGKKPCIQLDGTAKDRNDDSVVSRFARQVVQDSVINSIYSRYGVKDAKGNTSKLHLGSQKCYSNCQVNDCIACKTKRILGLKGTPYCKTAMGSWSKSNDGMLLTVPPATIDVLLQRYTKAREIGLLETDAAEVSKWRSTTFTKWLHDNPQQISFRGATNNSYINFLVANLPSMMYGTGISAIDIPQQGPNGPQTRVMGEKDGEVKIFTVDLPQKQTIIPTSSQSSAPLFVVLADDNLRQEAINYLDTSADPEAQEVANLLKEVPELWNDTVLRYSGYTVPYVTKFLKFLDEKAVTDVKEFILHTKSEVISRLTTTLKAKIAKYAKIQTGVTSSQLDEATAYYIEYMIDKNFIALRDNVDSHNKIYSRENLTLHGVSNAVVWVRMYLGMMSTLVTTTQDVVSDINRVKVHRDDDDFTVYDPAVLDTIIIGRPDLQPSRRNLKAHVQPSTLTVQEGSAGYEVRMSNLVDILEAANPKDAGEFKVIFSDMGDDTSAATKMRRVSDVLYNPKTSHIKYEQDQVLRESTDSRRSVVVNRSMITCSGRSILNMQRFRHVGDTVSARFGGLLGDQIVHITPRGVQLTCDDVFRAMITKIMTQPRQRVVGELFFLRMDSITFHVGITSTHGVRCYFEGAGRFSRLAKRISHNGMVGVSKHSTQFGIQQKRGGKLSIF